MIVDVNGELDPEFVVTTFQEIIHQMGGYIRLVRKNASPAGNHIVEIYVYNNEIEARIQHYMLTGEIQMKPMSDDEWEEFKDDIIEDVQNNMVKYL